ncbi:hypothetical protein [Pseudoduganella sp. OTU4001]|uniref:hypothetical protein n=1 Tax=Pseudoduganella sp. OTU4001 TaxID=3043854 RepID=UPI00313B90EA
MMPRNILAAAACAALAMPVFAQEIAPARKGVYSETDATGYQFNHHLNAELGSRQTVNEHGKIDRMSLTLKGRYPITEKVDLYGRASYDHIVYLPETGRKKTVNDAEAAVGASYSINRKAGVHLETQRAKDLPANVNVGAALSF